MSSINTNVAAMTALQTLSQTNKELTETQNRISTGYRVADASDNAAYWSIATTMRSDNAALSTVQDALGLGAATVDIAYTGVNSAIKVVDQIKSKLVAARQPGVDRDKIQSEITELQSQLRGIAEFGLVLRPELAVGRLRRSRLQRHQDHRLVVLALGRRGVDRHHQHRPRQHQAVRRRRPVGHPRHPKHDHQRRRRPTRSPVTDAARYLGADRQLARPRRPRGDHRRGRRRHRRDDQRGDRAGCGQGAHRHPAGLRQEPDGCRRAAASASWSMPT